MVEALSAMDESARLDAESTPEPLILWGGQEAASGGIANGIGWWWGRLRAVTHRRTYLGS